MNNCYECLQSKPIVNKKYNLCDDCNFMRLHDGKTKSEVYAERSASKPKKVYQLKQTPIKRSNKPIKQVTSKQSKRSAELSDLKYNIELQALQDGNYYCWGCGHAKGALDKSHILSVRQRKDLELDPNNINLFCRTCHMDWESNDILKMLKLHSFDKDLQYIQNKDKNRYNSILDALNYFVAHFEEYIESQELRTLYEKALILSNNNDYLI